MLIDLVPVETLCNLQEHFATLGQVTVCIANVEGELLTEPTWGSKYSKLIGTSDRGQRDFADAVSRCVMGVSREAAITCHEGMTLYAAPIDHDDVSLAVIVVGTRLPVPPPPDIVHEIATDFGVDLDALLGEARIFAPYSGGTPEAIRQFAHTLAQTLAMLYGQAARIQHQLSDLQTVHGFTELLAGNRDLQEILDLTVQRVVEVMAIKACAIRLHDPDTDELVVKAVHNLSAEYLQKGPVLLHENTIDAAAFSGQAVHLADVPGDPRTRYPQNARREGIVSGLCVPMAYRGRTIGVIRVYTAQTHRFDESEEALLRSIGSQAAAAVITGKLWEEQAAAERFHRQVEAAAAIQRRMLPEQPPQHKHLEFGCVYDPTLEVGGDFYDFIELPNGDVGLCVADVVGKGLPAALLMSSIRSALRAHAPQFDDPTTVLEKVNQHMYRDTMIEEFATLFYGVFAADSPTLTYCNAGHTAPLLVRRNTEQELTTGGMVIGVLPEEVFEQERIELQPGDLLVAFTDGVTEAMSFEGQAYGIDRVRESIRKYGSLDPQQLASQMLWDVRRFAGLAEQSDDITIVVARVC